MSDDPAYTASLVTLCDRFVAEMRAALGDAVQERAVVVRALEDYKANRRTHGIFPEDEGNSHFFLADGVYGDTPEQNRKPPVEELGLDKAGTARIADLFMDVLGI